jgi:hypothetical protein
MCTLLQIAPKIPHDVAQVADKLLPSTCMLLEGLEKVYSNRDKEDSEDEFESTDGDLEGKVGRKYENNTVRIARKLKIQTNFFFEKYEKKNSNTKRNLGENSQ